MLGEVLTGTFEAFQASVLDIPTWAFCLLFTIFGGVFAFGIATNTLLRRQLLVAGAIGLFCSMGLMLYKQAHTGAATAFVADLSLFAFTYGLFIVPPASVFLGLLLRRYSQPYANALAIEAMTEAEVQRERERRGLPESAPIIDTRGDRNRRHQR